MRDFVGPGTWVASVKDPKVCFNLLVYTFCFTIRLRAVCSGEEQVVVEEFVEFFGKGGGELWTTVRDDLVIQSEAKVDFAEKEGSYLLGSDGFLDEAKNYPLCRAMVDQNQQGIKAGGDREVGNEVTRDLLEGVRRAGLDQGEGENSEVCLTCFAGMWHSVRRISAQIVQDPATRTQKQQAAMF